MVLALLLGEAMGRRYDGVVILAWTAAALLILKKKAQAIWGEPEDD